MFSIEELTIDVNQELEIAAPMATVFESMVHCLSKGQLGNDDIPLALELERRPGGRWFRDLGNGRGHLWGLVQSIREPDLLELSGPLFMSYPVSNHIIIRLAETDGGTGLTFHHRAFGLIEAQHREGVVEGWKRMLARVADRSEQQAGKESDDRAADAARS